VLLKSGHSFGGSAAQSGYYSNSCRSRKFFTPPQPSPRVRGGSKKFTNDFGSLYDWFQ